MSCAIATPCPLEIEIMRAEEADKEPEQIGGHHRLLVRLIQHHCARVGREAAWLLRGGPCAWRKLVWHDVRLRLVDGHYGVAALAAQCMIGARSLNSSACQRVGAEAVLARSPAAEAKLEQESKADHDRAQAPTPSRARSDSWDRR